MSKTAFISQPMKGKSEDQIREERKELVQKLKEMGYETIDSVFSDFPNVDDEYTSIPLAYLSKSLNLLAKCNGVAFASGWENARGCKIEHECAKEYGIPILID